MIFNIVVRFKIQIIEEKKCINISSIEHALDYISRIHVDLIYDLMEALRKI